MEKEDQLECGSPRWRQDGNHPRLDLLGLAFETMSGVHFPTIFPPHDVSNWREQMSLEIRRKEPQRERKGRRTKEAKDCDQASDWGTG